MRPMMNHESTLLCNNPALLRVVHGVVDAPVIQCLSFVFALTGGLLMPSMHSFLAGRTGHSRGVKRRGMSW